MTKYVIVTAISSYRMRYAVPVDELQQMNPDVSIEGREIEWANDSVTCEEVQEFSQKHIGEQIVDTKVISEEEMLELFDKDNDYLKHWSTENKIDYLRKWRLNYEY